MEDCNEKKTESRSGTEVPRNGKSGKSKAKSGKFVRAIEVVRASTTGLLGGTLPKELRFPESMQLRHQGQEATPREIARIYGQQKDKRDIVFFIHGLMYDETCWAFSRFNMTEAFEKDFNVFPVHIRYDSGRHISENGLEFAHLLEEIFQNLGSFEGRWHIVAHSMGGLVSRSALYQAHKAGMGFSGCVDRVFLLAVPNRGAPLEKGVQLARLLLRFVPYPLLYTAVGLRLLFSNIRVNDQAPLSPVSEITDFYVHALPSSIMKLADGILDMRSEGIRDLRHGYLLQEEWESEEAWGGMKPKRVPVHPLPGARYYAVAGSLSKDPSTEPSNLVMDGMISSASAANIGSDDELCFLENDRYRMLAGVNHFVMPFSPEVYQALSEWLAED